MAREHELHLAAALKHVIRAAGISAREIERRLGMSGGYVSRLTSGRLEVKVSHLFDILDALGLQPAEFFVIAFPLRQGERSPLMRRLLEMSPLASPGPASPEPGEVEQRVLEAVRKALAELTGRSGQA
jgi:transcriptional regulator with XRE-family HTH domain